MIYPALHEKEQSFHDHRHADIADENHAAALQQNRVFLKWLRLPSVLKQAAWAWLSYDNFLGTNKLSFKMRLAVFEKHFNNFTKIIT